MNGRTDQGMNGSSDLESPFINEQFGSMGSPSPAQQPFLAEVEVSDTAAEWEDGYAAEAFDAQEDRFSGAAFEGGFEGEDFGATEDFASTDNELYAEHEEDRFSTEQSGAFCRECGTAREGFEVDTEGTSELEEGFEAFAYEDGQEAESLRQDELAQEAELGLFETPFIQSWQSWASEAGDVPSDIAAFANTLGIEWSRRRNGSPTTEAMSQWLLQDYRDTLVGARKRWGKKFGTGKFTLDAFGRAWMVSRRENMLFQSGSAGVASLGPFAPPAGTVSLVSSKLIEDSDKSKVAPLLVRFVETLVGSYGKFKAANYAGHGGGKFNGRGFSLDLYINGLDDRGFYPKDEAIKFLRYLHEAATKVGAQWRIIYNDFSVADVVNRALGRQHVIFVGSTRKVGNTVSGLNWHGPAPLILHFHLDLAPLSGAASRWNGATAKPSVSPAPGSPRPVSAASTSTTALAQLEEQQLQLVRASWQRAGLTPPERSQLGKLKAGKKGYSRYIGSGLFVDDVATMLRSRNLLSISDDDIDMLQRASNVETGGRLTALNSWDSAFMSVGFMQWTLKYKKLQQWIALAPDAFRRYGIALEPSRVYKFAADHKEKAIIGAANPSDVRSAEWGVRFYMASLDLDAVIAEYRRALEVAQEVRRAIVDPHGAAVVAHYNKSPVMRALVQETHNNRPAYMRQAMKNVASKANTDTASFLDIVRKEIVRVYTVRENAPNKAHNLDRKTRSRRV